MNFLPPNLKKNGQGILIFLKINSSYSEQYFIFLCWNIKMFKFVWASRFQAESLWTARWAAHKFNKQKLNKT